MKHFFCNAFNNSLFENQKKQGADCYSIGERLPMTSMCMVHNRSKLGKIYFFKILKYGFKCMDR